MKEGRKGKKQSKTQNTKYSFTSNKGSTKGRKKSNIGRKEGKTNKERKKKYCRIRRNRHDT